MLKITTDPKKAYARCTTSTQVIRHPTVLRLSCSKGDHNRKQADEGGTSLPFLIAEWEGSARKESLSVRDPKPGNPREDFNRDGCKETQWNESTVRLRSANKVGHDRATGSRCRTDAGTS